MSCFCFAQRFRGPFRYRFLLVANVRYIPVWLASVVSAICLISYKYTKTTEMEYVL